MTLLFIWIYIYWAYRIIQKWFLLNWIINNYSFVCSFQFQITLWRNINIESELNILLTRTVYSCIHTFNNFKYQHVTRKVWDKYIVLFKKPNYVLKPIFRGICHLPTSEVYKMQILTLLLKDDHLVKKAHISVIPAHPTRFCNSHSPSD